jgi:hypothetical protein
MNSAIIDKIDQLLDLYEVILKGEHELLHCGSVNPATLQELNKFYDYTFGLLFELVQQYPDKFVSWNKFKKAVRNEIIRTIKWGK